MDIMGYLSLLIGIVLGLIGSAISQSIQAQTELNKRIASNLRAQAALRDALGACDARDNAISGARARLISLQDQGRGLTPAAKTLEQRLEKLRVEANAVDKGKLWGDLVELERDGRNLRYYKPFRGLSLKVANIRWNVVFTIISVVQLLAEIRAWRLSSIEAEQAAKDATKTPCNTSGGEVSPQIIQLISETINEI